jgi:hypothetical protein
MGDAPSSPKPIIKGDNHMSTIEILRRQFETEYVYTEVGVQTATSQKEKNDYIQCAIQRCLGMATIVQFFGASFKEVEPLYEEIRSKIMALGD